MRQSCKTVIWAVACAAECPVYVSPRQAALRSAPARQVRVAIALPRGNLRGTCKECAWTSSCDSLTQHALLCCWGQGRRSRPVHHRE